MSVIKFSGVESTVELIKTIDQAIAVAQSGLDESEAVLEDLIELKARNAILETEIKEARKTMYLLVFEKFTSRQLACLEEYEALLERQSEAIAPPPPPKEKK